MKMSLALSLAVALSASAAQASELDFNISDESANANVSFLPPARNFDVGGGYLYHKGGTHIVNADFHARGRTALGNLPTTVGVGLQFNGWDEGNLDGTAIGIGGYANLQFPSVPGLGFNTSAHFAPSITSFGDTDHFLRWDAKLTYRVIQNADIYLGYRQVKADLDGHDDITLDEGALAGFIMHF